MDTEVTNIRKYTIQKILAKQDDSFRWGYNEKQASDRPEYLYYSPNFKATLWTLILLADIQTPTNIPQVNSSIQLATEHFYDPEHGIFRLPGMIRFPIPCLNGNMLYIQNYFELPHSKMLDKTIGFFAAYQRFDDGDFKTPKSYPYCSNTYCYGKHTCYWGVTKLLKGISYIPRHQRSSQAQKLMENCIDFVLHHEVCFSSHHSDRLIHEKIGELTFPNFYTSDFLELLWLLAREKVHDRRMSRALSLLLSKMKDGGFWVLEKSMNMIVSIGQKNRANAFIKERATEVLDYYEIGTTSP